MKAQWIFLTWIELTKSTTKGPDIQIKDANVAETVNPVLRRDVGNIWKSWMAQTSSIQCSYLNTLYPHEEPPNITCQLWYNGETNNSFPIRSNKHNTNYQRKSCDNHTATVHPSSAISIWNCIELFWCLIQRMISTHTHKKLTHKDWWKFCQR